MSDDNDYSYVTNCAIKEGGTWWFVKQDCFTNANLNRWYLTKPFYNYEGIHWYHHQDSFPMTLKKTTMMIRRFM